MNVLNSKYAFPARRLVLASLCTLTLLAAAHGQTVPASGSSTPAAGSSTPAAGSSTIGSASAAIYGADQGVAIEGYDVVAYFTEKKPQQGSEEFSTTHAGTTWRFASQANLDLFRANPDAYVPQYGGYCAYGASTNVVATSSPRQWKVVDGKLYLNNNTFARLLWENNIPQNIASGNGNWPGLNDKINTKAAKR